MTLNNVLEFNMFYSISILRKKNLALCYIKYYSKFYFYCFWIEVECCRLTVFILIIIESLAFGNNTTKLFSYRNMIFPEFPAPDITGFGISD